MTDPFQRIIDRAAAGEYMNPATLEMAKAEQARSAIKKEVIIGDARLLLGDCMEILPMLGRFDAVITDPPYGINEAAGKNKSRCSLTGAGKWKGSKNTRGAGVPSTDFGYSEWDAQPLSGDLMKLVLGSADIQIIFGGNYFDLPPTSCFLVWDKANGTTDFADAELAWTNMPKAVRLKKWLWNGMLQQDMANKETRLHPTQKPVPVMTWCIEQAGNPETILDPFAGSGTTGVAAIQLGRKFTGIEKDAGYFDIACRRIEQAYAQGQLFTPERAKQTQDALL